LKILVVDDAELSLMFATRVLEQHGHDVVALRSGEAAVDLLKKGEWPQVIFLDWMMPGMDGLDVCRAIRASPDGGRVFIVIITARALEADRREAIGAGANLHIAKPARAEDMENAVLAAAKMYQELGISVTATPSSGGNNGAAADVVSSSIDDFDRSG
jgi:CheY-like chemotaxis protein